MKKTFALISALAVLMVMLFAACGTGDDMTTDPNSGLSSSTSDASNSGTSESDPLGGLLEDDGDDGNDDESSSSVSGESAED